MFVFEPPFLITAFILLCSSGNARFLGRVIGGEDAKDMAYPYQASLRVNGFHKCGGSLLNHRWILTAAHCIVNFNRNDMTVVLGTNNLVTGGIAYFTERLVVHPLYSQAAHDDDIGLIEIIDRVDYNDAIRPIGLPMRDVDEKNCIATFTGWGNTALNVVNHNDLQVIKLTVMDTPSCHSIFPMVGRGHLCTLTVNGEGVCYGDSGGPLVDEGIQIAIASWGVPCARGYPDVHTKVYKYTQWIKSIID